MDYSAKLKLAMAEIIAVIEKYDIAGIVALHDIDKDIRMSEESVGVTGFSESLFMISPSYSAASIENDLLRLKGHAAHYNSSDERDIQMAHTMNMFDQLTQMIGKAYFKLDQMLTTTENMLERIQSDDDGLEITTDNPRDN